MTSGSIFACLVGLVLFPVLWRNGRMREAMRLTFSAPAWLVPVAFTSAVTLGSWALGLGTVDNPWIARDAAASLLLCAVTTLGLAGQVGMLRAYREGRVGDSGDFLRGMQEHTLALLVGKLLVCGASALLYGTLLRGRHSPALDVLYLAPNMLLAALVGTTALRGGEVWRPLRHALELGMREPGKVAMVVIAQAVWLGALFLLFAPGRDMSLLGTLASSLSHGQSPALLFSRSLASAIAWLALSGVGSSVCITALVLGVTKGFEADAAPVGKARATAPRTTSS